MLFPKNRMKLTKTYQGKTDPEGWIVLDLAGLDLEGANKLYLPMADIEKLKTGGDTQADRLQQARALLGGDDLPAAEEEDESDEKWTSFG